MQQKKKFSRKVISYVLALVMAFSTFTGIVPGTSITAHAASISYVDGSGTTQTVDATELAASTISWTDGSWYIVPEGGLTISGRIAVGGTVNLILRDGATLTANAGITTTNATLNIYAQSEGTGALTATGSNGSRSTGGSAGIGGTGGNGAAGGAGGTVNIYGGIVTATGGKGPDYFYDGGGAGIGGGGGGQYSGNGGAGGTVNIYGGTVKATGGTIGNFAAGSGNGTGIGGGGKALEGSNGAAGTLTLGKGVILYNGTDNTGTVLDDQASESRSYSGDRYQNMFAEYIAQGPDKTALNDAITAAETLYDSIKNNNDYTEVANTFQTAINTAKGVADSDEVDQDAVDTATSNIITANTNAVIGIINALPATSDVTMDDKTVIEAVRAAYDALDDTQKAKVSADTLKKLTDAEAALKDVTDTAAANTVSETITALPAADEVTTADKTDIEAARAAYEALTDDQKAKVSADTLKKLTDAEDALAAAGVSATINALPAADNVTTADKATIEAAREAYDALTDDQKAKVSADTLKKLTDAEDALEVAEVIETITALKDADEVTTADKTDIEAARATYEALTDDQKAKVSDDTLKKLTDAESALEVAVVNKAIADLPNADNVTVNDKDDIEAARTAYEALTDDQKMAVDADTLAKLEAVEIALVNKTIEALPEAASVTANDKDAIEAAREAYDALTDDQKEKVSVDTLKKLTDAEDALAAAGVSDEINALPVATEVTTDNKDAIEAARAAFDELTAAQKAYVSEDTLKKLTDAEAALKEVIDDLAAEDVTDAIDNLPASDKVSTTDKAAIEAARKAYDALTEDQKKKVSDETLKKLEDAEVALAKAEKDAEDTAAADKVTETIKALPASDKVATTDKAAIEAARKAYDALTEDQKKKVSADTLKKLTDAETALAEAERKASDDSDKKDDSKPEYKNEWVDGQWYDADGTSNYDGKGSWKNNSAGWWYEDTSGWYPVASWQKIDGKWYYFDAAGYMASNEWVGGYWLSGNGAWEYEYSGSWKTNGIGWWFEDESGWYPVSQWQKIDGKWYYFGSDGIMATNQYIGDYWVGSDGSWQ